jgi:DNA-binding NarL/FixJ family response regulator
MYRVFLVDERPLPRAALRALLATDDRVVVVGEASTLDELVDRSREADVGVVIADYPALGGHDGLPTSGRLGDRLLLTNVPPLARAGGFDGAAGWPDRDATFAELLDAIGAIERGGRYVGRSLSSDAARTGATATLSRREFEVLRALAAGRTNREIAADLGISVKTIDTHRGHVLKKLALRNNSDLTRFAIRHGFLASG